jgi:hypothetical protein
MNWQRGIELEPGDAVSVDSELCELNLRYERDEHQGILHYSRPEYETPESDDTIEQTIIQETKAGSITLDFLPIYPERPIVFELEDELKIPPGQKGFFCVTFRIEYGFTLRRTDTVVERLLPNPRKHSYWGPPNNGVSTFRELSELYQEPKGVMTDTDTSTAIVPIHYSNEREEGDLITHCLVPLRELDLYRNENDDLIFEVVRLSHQDEFYQEPEPLKRAPKEMKQDVKKFLSGPDAPKSLFDQVASLPKLNRLTSVFLNR